MVGNNQIFGVFLEVLPFLQFHPITTLHFSMSSPTSCPFHILMHSFLSSLTSLGVRKIIWFAPWGGEKKSMHHVLLHWTLSLNEHRLGQSGLGITDQ